MESKKACYMHAFLFLLLSPQGRELLRCGCVLDRYDGGCCTPQGRELVLIVIITRGSHQINRYCVSSVTRYQMLENVIFLQQLAHKM